MTNKEAAKWLKTFKGHTGMAELSQAFDVAIEALEQRSILDKIKAKIETLNPVDYVSMFSYEGHRGASDMKHDVLDIIDKYTAESEE